MQGIAVLHIVFALPALTLKSIHLNYPSNIKR